MFIASLMFLLFIFLVISLLVVTRVPVNLLISFYSSGRDFSWHHFVLMFAYRYGKISPINAFGLD